MHRLRRRRCGVAIWGWSADPRGGRPCGWAPPAQAESWAAPFGLLIRITVAFCGASMWAFDVLVHFAHVGVSDCAFSLAIHLYAC